MRRCLVHLAAAGGGSGGGGGGAAAVPRSAEHAPLTAEAAASAFRVPLMGRGTDTGLTADIVAASVPREAAAPEWKDDLKVWDVAASNVDNRCDNAAVAELKERSLADRNLDPVAEAQAMASDGWRVGKRTLVYTLDCLRRQGRLTEASDLADRLAANGMFAGTYGESVIPLVYAQSGEQKKVVHFFKRVSKKQPTLQFVNELAMVLAKQGKPVVALLEAMVGDPDAALRPDEILFRTAVARHPSVAERTALRQMMQRLRIKPSKAGHRMLLTAASRRGDPVAAEEAVAMLGEGALEEKDWTKLLVAYGSTGDLSGATVILGRMKRCGVDFEGSPHLLQALLSSHAPHIEKVLRDGASAGDAVAIAVQARELYDFAARRGFVKSDPAFFVTAMVGAYAAASMTQKGEELAAAAAKEYGLTPRQQNAAALRRKQKGGQFGDDVDSRFTF